MVYDRRIPDRRIPDRRIPQQELEAGYAARWNIFYLSTQHMIESRRNMRLGYMHSGCQEVSSAIKHTNVRLFMDQEQSFQVANFVYECMAVGGRRDVRTRTLSLLCHPLGMNGEVAFIVRLFLDQEVTLLRQ